MSSVLIVATRLFNIYVGRLFLDMIAITRGH